MVYKNMFLVFILTTRDVSDQRSRDCTVFRSVFGIVKDCLDFLIDCVVEIRRHVHLYERVPDGRFYDYTCHTASSSGRRLEPGGTINHTTTIRISSKNIIKY